MNHTRCILHLRSSSSTVTYILHRTQQRKSMKEKGEGRKRERKRDEGREGVSEGLKVEKGEIEGRARDEILYNERKKRKK